jgi:hypothetical protein
MPKKISSSVLRKDVCSRSDGPVPGYFLFVTLVCERIFVAARVVQIELEFQYFVFKVVFSYMDTENMIVDDTFCKFVESGGNF